MKPTPAQLLPIYRQNLKRYEEAGDEERATVQRRLIARMEVE